MAEMRALGEAIGCQECSSCSCKPLDKYKVWVRMHRGVCVAFAHQELAEHPVGYIAFELLHRRGEHIHSFDYSAGATEQRCDGEVESGIGVCWLESKHRLKPLPRVVGLPDRSEGPTSVEVMLWVVGINGRGITVLGTSSGKQDNVDLLAQYRSTDRSAVDLLRLERVQRLQVVLAERVGFGAIPTTPKPRARYEFGSTDGCARLAASFAAMVWACHGAHRRQERHRHDDITHSVSMATRTSSGLEPGPTPCICASAAMSSAICVADPWSIKSSSSSARPSPSSPDRKTSDSASSYWSSQVRARSAWKSDVFLSAGTAIAQAYVSAAIRKNEFATFGLRSAAAFRSNAPPAARSLTGSVSCVCCIAASSCCQPGLSGSVCANAIASSDAEHHCECTRTDAGARGLEQSGHDAVHAVAWASSSSAFTTVAHRWHRIGQ
eukprot:m.109618 g.109618  ORF g.109618 m.109618 type:complete len:437 (+) comp21275_c0_seq3:1750-3060(+)